MAQTKQKLALLLCSTFLSMPALPAQKHPTASEQSCLHFTQLFYNWYAKTAARSFDAGGAAPWHQALKYNGNNPFSPELTRALNSSDAEAKADGDPVLDFDPILNTQDAADRYVVQRVTYKNGRYWAEVYGIWSRPVPRNRTLQVVAEMIFQSGRWRFLNFHYPNHTSQINENLISLLKYQYRPK